MPSGFLRDVELILAAWGIVVSDETIQGWGLRFGCLFTNALKRRRPLPGDKRVTDEVFVHSRQAALLVACRQLGRESADRSRIEPT